MEDNKQEMTKPIQNPNMSEESHKVLINSDEDFEKIKRLFAPPEAKDGNNFLETIPVELSISISKDDDIISNPFDLIDSIVNPETSKSQTLKLLSELIPNALAENNETMVEAVLEEIKIRCGLSKTHLDALRKDINNARINNKQRTVKKNGEISKPREEELTEWRSIAEPLISSNNILEKVGEVLRGVGLVGHEREAKIIYLALTSRISDAPVNIVVKAASSAGKNHLIKQVLKLFPASAFYELSSMSDKALIHWDEPLSSRYLVLYEAAGLSSEFVSYIIRSLLSEGKVRYSTARGIIEKNGPTGFITTSTAALHPENETRMVSLGMDESPEQTRRVLQAQARGQRAIGVDLVPFKAFQRVIELEKLTAIIPYAERLAEATAPVAIRLRRDFPTVLTFIKAHAILHAGNRDRDAQGSVVVTLADYEAVYDLLSDLLDSMILGEKGDEDPKFKQAVAAVTELSDHGQNGEGVNIRMIATHLRISDKTAWRRVKAAITAGALLNLEIRSRAEAKIVLGNPLTDHILPEPQKLMVPPA